MKKYIIILIVLITVITGCEEVMDVEYDKALVKTLAVDARFTNDTTAHKAELTWVTDFFKTGGNEYVTEAEINITDGENIYPLHMIEDGIYVTDSNVYGEIGKEYTMNIKLKSGEEFSATDRIDPLPEIDSITTSDNYDHYNPNFGRYGFGYDILYYGPENQEQNNYYMWNLYVDNKLYTDTIYEVVFIDDEFVDAYVSGFEVFFVRDTDVINDPTLVTLEMASISKECYDYLIGLMLETVWRGSPWDGPPANVPSNFGPDVAGFFQASAIKRKSVEIKKLPRKE